MSQNDWHNKCFYRVSLKAVILDPAGKLLVVREKNNPSWNLPGGGMDYGETEYQALKRELFEEVGYQGSFTYRALGIRPMFLQEKQAWQLWVVYAVTPEQYTFTVGHEADEIAFMVSAEATAVKPYLAEFIRLAAESHD